MDRSEALGALKETATEILAVEPDTIVEEARFREDLGADSLDLVEIIMALEDRFGVSVSEEDAKGITTVGQGLDVFLNKAAVT